jgi:hypothetical protein
MVVPAAVCLPCVTGAASLIGTGVPAVLSGAAVGAGYYSLKKSNKKTKPKKTKPKKTKPKKTKPKKLKGGGISLKKNMKNINNKYTKCTEKCHKKKYIKKPSNVSLYEWKKTLSPEEKKQWNKQVLEKNKCWSKCYKIKKNDIRLHKKKYSKEYKKINENYKNKCCKCHYIKTKKTLRKVRGPYSHCSYDSDNCCKDKKTIIKPKN